VYSIPLLARHNESHVLAHFSEYVESGNYKKLLIQSPDAAIDLVKSYLDYSHPSNLSTAVDSAPPRINKFREWLASESTPLP
jgi:hypothetical protein